MQQATGAAYGVPSADGVRRDHNDDDSEWAIGALTVANYSTADLFGMRHR